MKKLKAFWYNLIKAEVMERYYHSSLQAKKYLKSVLKNLSIKICCDEYANIIDLMDKRCLEGWCHHTSQSAILFFKDNDYIERGYLKISEHQQDYYHSWIVFNYKNKEYVFDPCLNCICKKEMYHKIFEIDETKKVEAKEIREFFNKKIVSYKERGINYSDNFKRYVNSLVDKDELLIDASSKFNEYFTGMHVGYKIEIKNEKIDKVKAHYYL